MATIDSLNISISTMSFIEAQSMIVQSRNLRRVFKTSKSKAKKSPTKRGKKSLIAGMTASDKAELLAMLEGVEL